MRLKIEDNPIKFEVEAVSNMSPRMLRVKKWRGAETEIERTWSDGYKLDEIKFKGVAFTHEDAIALSEFFKIHAYSLPYKNGSWINPNSPKP